MIQGAILISRSTGKPEYGRNVMEVARKYIEAL
jgi:hypothetical protein